MVKSDHYVMKCRVIIIAESVFFNQVKYSNIKCYSLKISKSRCNWDIVYDDIVDVYFTHHGFLPPHTETFLTYIYEKSINILHVEKI